MRPVLLALAFVLAGFLQVGCRKVHSPSPTGQWPRDMLDKAGSYWIRLEGLADRGWVVTRKPEKSVEHVGEALLWYGPARFAASCGTGEVYDQPVMDMLEATHGGLERYTPIGDYAGGHEVTFDDAVGFYLGVATAITRCGRGDQWKEPFALHLDYLQKHGHELYAGTGASMPPGLDLVVDLIAERLGLGPAHDAGKMTVAEGVLMGMLGGIQGKKTLHDADPSKYPLPACYQANLAELWISSVEAFGVEVGENALTTMCITAKGMEIPTWEHRCERASLQGWLSHDWVENDYEFRHQRCGWEAKDGQGNQNPFVDWLYGASRAFGPLDQVTVGGGVVR